MLSAPSRKTLSTHIDTEQVSAASSASTTFSGIPQKATAPTKSTKRSAGTRKKIKGPLYRDPIWPWWSHCTNVVHDIIRKFVVVLSGHAARNPIAYVVGLTVLPLTMAGVGLFTNFNVQVDYDVIYAPHGSRPTEHMNWIYNQAGFPEGTRPFTLLLHDQGGNAIGKQGVEQMFQVIDTLRNTAGYADVCSHSSYSMEYPNGTDMKGACNILGVTRFWYFNQELFLEQAKTDRQVMQAISNHTYPDGVPVNHDFILGQYEWTNETVVYNPALDKEIVWQTEKTITMAKSFLETLLLPDAEGADEFELAAIENLRALQEQWRETAAVEERDGLEYRTMQLEFFTLVSYNTEFERAIFDDIPLVFLVGVIMVGFTMVVFFKPDRVQSRSLLGISSVHTIAMSLAMAHGLLFIIGIPFTNMNMMLPFVVFGVGLDDTFIITGAYFRTSPKKDTVERIHETMEEVGSSISLTTITTMLAFGLGYISSIPAIQWLCLYAFLSIGFDFIFQVTLFTAFIVLDERRVKANRKDLCCCITAKKEESASSDPDGDGEANRPQEQAIADAKEVDATDHSEGPALAFMTWYANFLMRPFVKALVLSVFLYFMGFCVYRTTLLTQEFIISDFLPQDSYVADYLSAVDDYATEMIPVGIYFRHMNQSDPQVQQQMRDYISELMDLEQLDTPPPFCWVTDFGNETDQLVSEQLGVDISHLTFNQKLDLALSDSRIKQVYGDDIVRDEDGNITASRCVVFLRNIDFDEVESQIKMLNDQRAVSAAQPANQGQDDWSMFTFHDLYFLWEFYSVAVTELIITTIAGVVAVTLIAFFLMPHWTAVLFVFPTILMLYVDLLGTLQLAGLHINAVTYVCLTISIGLLVDFLMHIMLRYYESAEVTREEKVKDTLKTMGVSILVGGLSTFLAVIPLAFSTSAIIGTVFTAFFSMVTLGVAHGLIFLPVVLSLVGPTTTPRLHPVIEDTDTDNDTKFISRLDVDESFESLSQTSGPLPIPPSVEPDTLEKETLEQVTTLIEV